MSSTRQEMTVMVNSMDKSYAEQGTNCDEAFSFMDTHNLNGRCKCMFSWILIHLSGFPEFQIVLGKWKQKYSLRNSYISLVSPVPSNSPGNFSMCHGFFPWDDVVKVIGPDQRSQEAAVTFLKHLAMTQRLLSSPKRHLPLIILFVV